MKKDEFKSGYAAVLGRPNVGKSTLVNYLLKENISIVSDKPQTTRDSIIAILSGEDYQVILVDTPGIHAPRTKLGEYMVSSAFESGKDADERIVIVDAPAGITAEDRSLFSMLKKENSTAAYTWTAVLINKIDMVSKQDILPVIDACRREIECDDYIPVSALTGENLDLVLRRIVERLPPGPAYYPPEQLTDKSERFIVGELIREQALLLCRQEVPHAVAVEVDTFKEDAGRKVLIQATIFLERQTQKGIIIGHNGRMLKQIGICARKKIEEFLQKSVYLQLWVKVQENWRKDDIFLRRLGYKKT
ncbi:MAG: GTPase Era [Candidatus Omnitrophica bacterium]|nr:GTPase Era [Candidatus Omnitrophota bacterium]